ncbi:amino acid permease [Sphingomonas sp.]|uniref:amino acid permease n=1 Tax=Sphingomonas sp. TaxID=28214 RepID=UPI003B3AA17A
MSGDLSLRQALNGTQMSLIAIGGAVGTGLFLGSGFAVGLAGPSVLLSYAIGAVIALLLMIGLAEMVIVQPRAGNFGTFASTYIGPTAGLLVNYAYLSANLLAIGTEATAVALALRVWMPDVPTWVWVAASAVSVVAVNIVTIRAFGVIESTFALIKIGAILFFITLGVWYFVSAPPASNVGTHLLIADGGFFPNGLRGTWFAVVVTLFSYMGVELIAVTAAEAVDPRAAVLKAVRLTFARLALFYLATLSVVLTIVPWRKIGTQVSPFVVVMEHAHLPSAAGLLNLVVLIAALSAMNSQLYGASRTVFGLAMAGQAPGFLKGVSRNGVPLPALTLAASGMAVAIGINAAMPEHALEIMIALASFGAIFTWLMIFLSHIAFRRSKRTADAEASIAGGRLSSYLGAVLVTAVLITTLFMPAFRLTVVCGIPLLIIVAALGRRHTRKAAVQK